MTGAQPATPPVTPPVTQGGPVMATPRRTWRLGRTILAVVAMMSLLGAACSASDDTSATGADDNATADATDSDAATNDSSDTAGDTTPGGGALAATPVPSAGCGTSKVGAVANERREVDVTDSNSGDNRWYLLNTPDAHDGTTPIPVVVSFHGLSEGAEVHAVHSNLAATGNAEGFVVAFPNGTGSPVRWNVLPTDDDVETDTANDLALVDAMLDDLASELCIDLSAVYATGLSNGGGMSSYMACERADRFAAVAPIAGLRPPIRCDSDATTPILSVHGTADPILLYNGGIADLPALLDGGEVGPPPPAEIDGPGYPASARAWARHNGCAPDPEVTTIGDDVEHWVFDCPEGNDVEFYVVVDGGHTWPGSDFSVSIAQIAGPTTFTIDANDTMWEFFSRHRLAAG